MRRSTDHILVSHAGNLPMPDQFDRLVKSGASKAGNTEYLVGLSGAVNNIVAKQIDVGIDVVNDGEFAKTGSYDGYLHDRVTGFSTKQVDRARSPKRGGPGERDRLDFPGFYASGLWHSGSGGPVRPGFATPG